MNELKNYTEKELQTVLKFTNDLVNTQMRSETKFSDMEVDAASLIEAERNALAYADRRKTGRPSGTSLGEADEEVGEIRDGIKDWLRRTNRVVNG